MNRAVPPARRSALARLTMLAGAAVLVAACGGASPTLAPTAGIASPSSEPSVGATAGSTAVPSATADVTASTPPVTAPPVTEPPVTEPPVTEPPPTAPPPTAAPGIGVKLQVGDQQYMTVLAAEQWPGTSTVKPKKGKAFYTVEVRIDAITLTSFDQADFKIRDAAGHSYANRLAGRAPNLYYGNGMEPEHFYFGWITYEIPKTTVGNITLIYKPGFLGGKTITVPLF